MQLIDKNGNVFGGGIEITGPDGKPKTTGGGGGSPTGPAGGDLYGTYPNPGVDWNLGISTYSMYYYPLSSNPAGYITTAALSGYLTTATAASTYYPLTNPNAFISGITGSDVVTALGYTPYDATNPDGYIDSSALTPYLTSATAAATYQPTLVSATNIKTINGNSILGSGDLTVGGSGLTIGTTGITSGTIGRVLFEGTGNVLQQSTNLFWDNTNNRLGIGTSTPSSIIHSVGSVTASSGVARGNYFNNTLVASANNNALATLDILSTFNNGSFTGVSNYDIRTRNLITKQYFQSPTTNQGNHTIAFGFGGAGEQIKFIASAAGSSGRGNLYIASVSGDTAVATTANANALFTDTSNAFYKSFNIDQSALTTGNGLYLSGNQITPTINGIYFRYGESRVAILTKPHGSNGYADFRIAIVPVGGSNNPPLEADTKFMITKDTTNVLINTTTDAGFKLNVNGTARVSGNLTFGSSTSYLYGDTNNIRLYDKNNRIILQCYPSGVLNSETSLTSGTSATSSLRLRDDYASIEFSNTNSSSTVQNPIQFIKGYFGNIGATDKSIVTIKSVSYSNLTNATLLRGLYIDINDTTTYTGFTTFRAIESKKGGAYFNTTSANSSAILQADSTTQGFLPPRMTNAQMLAIAAPAAGLVVYDTTNNKHCGYNGTAWQNFY